MLIPATILSLIFASLGFLITKNNARYMISGYNTMSEEQRSLVDIDAYLYFFKRFHLFLGISVLLLVLLSRMINDNIAIIIMVVYPLLGYCYFIIKCNEFFEKAINQKTTFRMLSSIMMIVAIGVTILFFKGFQDSDMLIDGDKLEITGMYGEKISCSKILGIKLVDQLPEITMKSDGFAAGDFRKGYFRTKDRRTVKLIINKKENPLLLLNTTKGEIYFSSGHVRSKDLLLKIEKWKNPI